LSRALFPRWDHRRARTAPGQRHRPRDRLAGGLQERRGRAGGSATCPSRSLSVGADGRRAWDRAGRGPSGQAGAPHLAGHSRPDGPQDRTYFRILVPMSRGNHGRRRWSKCRSGRSGTCWRGSG